VALDHVKSFLYLCNIAFGVFIYQLAIHIDLSSFGIPGHFLDTI